MKYWIWLSTLPYIGAVSARKIMTVLKNPENVYYSSEEELRKIENLTLRQRNSILMNRELESAKRKVAELDAKIAEKRATLKNGRSSSDLKSLLMDLLGDDTQEQEMDR